jgi:predicted O-methyltransferase YrrM
MILYQDKLKEWFDPFENEKWDKEETREGLYFHNDPKILYQMIRHHQPKTYVELGPRGGRTTSIAVNASRYNIQEKFIRYGVDMNVDLHTFEMDTNFYNELKLYLDNLQEVNAGLASCNNCLQTHLHKNIIGSTLIDELDEIDFLFIDGLHDHILARWYVDNLFPKVKKGGVIHIHDMIMKNHDWNTLRASVPSSSAPLTNMDLSEERLKMYYPTIFDLYKEGIGTIWEGDVVADWGLENKEKIDYFNTHSLYGAGESLYIILKEKINSSKITPKAISGDAWSGVIKPG